MHGSNALVCLGLFLPYLPGSTFERLSVNIRENRSRSHCNTEFADATNEKGRVNNLGDTPSDNRQSATHFVPDSSNRILRGRVGANFLQTCTRSSPMTNARCRSAVDSSSFHLIIEHRLSHGYFSGLGCSSFGPSPALHVNSGRGT